MAQRAKDCKYKCARGGASVNNAGELIKGVEGGNKNKVFHIICVYKIHLFP